MKFDLALTWMKHGRSMRTSGFRGYWSWCPEKKTILMTTFNGVVIDFRDTKDLDFTLGFVLSDAWEFYVGHDDPRQNESSEFPKQMGEFFQETIDDTAPAIPWGDLHLDFGFPGTPKECMSATTDIKPSTESNAKKGTEQVLDSDDGSDELDSISKSIISHMALDLSHFYIDATEQEIRDHGFVDRNHVLLEARLQRERLGQDGDNAPNIEPKLTGKRPSYSSKPPKITRPFGWAFESDLTSLMTSVPPDGDEGLYPYYLFKEGLAKSITDVACRASQSVNLTDALKTLPEDSVIHAVTEIPSGPPGSTFTRIDRGDQGSITIMNTGKDLSIHLVSIDSNVSGSKSMAHLLTVASSFADVSQFNVRDVLSLWYLNSKYRHNGLLLTPTPLALLCSENELLALQQLCGLDRNDMVLLVSDE